MPKIHYVEHTGIERVVDVPVGWSVMEGAVKNSVAGILAECGGQCACATCHVYIRRPWFERLPPKTDMEESMLEFVQERRDNSRLACRLEVTVELDGMIAETPESQF